MTPGVRPASAISPMRWCSPRPPRRRRGWSASAPSTGFRSSPAGAGTGYAAGASPSRGGVILSLARLNRILGLESEALRIHAQAGAITGGIHAHAAAAGLYYPPDPGSSSTCTIGGNVACNAAGPHTLRYGVTADFVAGITAVLSDGRIVRLGEGGDTSASGLLSLLVGSEGTLGVITEVLLRLIPAPKTRSTLAATFTGMDRAADAVAEITAAGIVPAALEFLDAGALEAVRKAGGGNIGGDSAALLIVELEGDRGHRRRRYRGRLHRDHSRRRLATAARHRARPGGCASGLRARR